MKKKLFPIICLSTFVLISTLSSAQNLITNGDLEGSQLSSFRVNDWVNNKKKENQEPRIIINESSNHCIVVSTNPYAENTYDSQLLLTVDKPFNVPSSIILTMKVKADRAQSSRMQLHSTPGNYISMYDANINFTTQWTTVQKTIFIQDEQVQTLAIDLAMGYKNNLYFDDISVEISPKTIPPALISYTITVPEGPITQGDRIQVIYELTSRNYSFNNAFYGGIEGGVREKVAHETSNDNRIGKVKLTVDFTVNKPGRVKVFPATATVSGVTVYSDSAYIDVLPNPEYGQQWEKAEQFLIQHGIKSPNLIQRYKIGTLSVWSDDKQKCFVAIASDNYMPYIDNPILAYGIGESGWDPDKNADNSLYAILALYDLQLKHLLRHNDIYKSELTSIYKPKAEKKGPLLGDINYNQRYPYNKLFPYETSKDNGAKKQCVAGCGPVALAQVLSYYKHPITLKGKRAITTKSGKRYRKDLSEFQVKWDGTEDDIANLIYACAISVSADMSPDATSSNTTDLKHALIKYWGYSSNCRLMDDYYDYSKLATIYSELDNDRPLIFCDDKHLFVCDGYEGEYLHYNLGWGGSYNGYYRAIIVPSMFGKGQMPFKDIIMGIYPKKK